ncbi:MAG: carbohydrate ABC transporter permease [Brevinematia bacterium]
MPEIFSNKMSMEIVRCILILLIIVFSIFPVIILILYSFRPYREIISIPTTILPREFTLDNFIGISKKIDILRMIFNSLMVAGLITVSTLFLGTLAGYAFAKYNFKGKEPVFLLIISKLMIPQIVLVIPWIYMIAKLALMDNLLAVILPNLTGAWTIFFMRQYISQISDDYFDAARVDGANELEIFFKIVLPLIKPAVATVIIINFLWGWNEFLWPMLVLTSKENFLLSIGVAYVKYSGGVLTEGTVNYAMLAAISLIYALPILLTYIILARQFVQSIVLSGLKK